MRFDSARPDYRELEAAGQQLGRGFDSWDMCDQICWNLFDKTPYAYQKATRWCQQEKEFVRRAGFVMMAELAVHDKQAQDEAFLQFFPLIKQYAGDERNFVKKLLTGHCGRSGNATAAFVPWLWNAPTRSKYGFQNSPPGCKRCSQRITGERDQRSTHSACQGTDLIWLARFVRSAASCPLPVSLRRRI